MPGWSRSPSWRSGCGSVSGSTQTVTLAGSVGANSGAKALTVIGSVLAGGDCIDDVDLLRSGALPELFDGVRAPSTVGTWLRALRWGHVRQLDAVARTLLVQAWRAGAGPAAGADVTVDLDSTICEVYGLAKQGAARGYTGVRGYHPLLASCAGDAAGGGATQLLHARLRGGNAGSGRGAGSFVAEVLARLRDALPRDRAGRQGTVTLRADSGFYSREVIRACRRGGARFSVTVRMNPSVRRAIAAIPEQAWTPIPYWSSEGTFGHAADGTPISGADVAETAYTAFAGTPDAVDVRLVVRRVRPTPGSQLALDVAFSYHAFITDRDGAAARHRGRPPSARRRRAGHRRPERWLRAGPPALRPVCRQRRLVGPGRPGLQPRPLVRGPDQPPLAHHHHRHAPHPAAGRPRPDRAHRPPAAPAPAPALAVGSRLPAAPRRDRAARPHLTRHPPPAPTHGLRSIDLEAWRGVSGGASGGGSWGAAAVAGRAWAAVCERVPPARPSGYGRRCCVERGPGQLGQTKAADDRWSGQIAGMSSPKATATRSTVGGIGRRVRSGRGAGSG